MKKRTATISFASGRGNTMEIVFPRVVNKTKPNFSVNNKGLITFLEKNNNTKDKLVLLDKESTFIEFKKGLLDNIEKPQIYEKLYEEYHQAQIIDVSKGSSEDNKLIFEFLADNCESEFSYQVYANNNKYITTTFLDSAELCATYLIEKKGKLSIHIHSHPKEVHLEASTADTESAEYLHELKFKTKFKLYSPVTGEYIDYDKDSGLRLDEVIIKATKKRKK